MVNTKKIIYFIVAIILLILLEVAVLFHLNDIVLVNGHRDDVISEVKNIETFIDVDTGIKLEYELSDEILIDDLLVIRDKKITDKLMKENIVKYFSLSLHDSNNNKKRIKNTNIKVSVPLDESLLKYNELKVVRINSKLEITDDEFDININDESITFDIVMSSKYGIIGTN